MSKYRTLLVAEIVSTIRSIYYLEGLFYRKIVVDKKKKHLEVLVRGDFTVYTQ